MASAGMRKMARVAVSRKKELEEVILEMSPLRLRFGRYDKLA